ncbi:MAG TPA: nuclear transport factor 2 family protein [Gemmatimonadaceae bacterium]|nr:nuclear transport factor 2 family protein [Gemmatimonadaceae bacterium]
MRKGAEELIERDRVIETVVRLFVSTDQKDWTAVERCFTPQVRFDMTSVAGGTPQTVTPKTIADGWREGLAPIDHVHHQVGNFLVELEEARATISCYGIAYHYKERRSGQRTRVFVGSYDFELVKSDTGADRNWRIEAMRFNLKFIDGNAALEARE